MTTTDIGIPPSRVRPAVPIVAVLALLAGWLLGGGLATPVSAETVEALPAPGTLFHAFIDVAHKQIPLPPGLWQVAGSSDESLTDNRPGAYGVMESLVLFKREGGVVESFVVIHTNALPVDRGWGTSRECAAKTMPLARVYDEAGPNLLCAFGGPVTIRLDEGAPRFWHQALELARNQSWSIAERWLMSGFRISDRHDVVEVRYHYQPAPLETAEADSPSGVIAASWPGPGGAVANRSRGRPWLPALTGWSEAMKSPVEQGFKGRLSSRQENPRLPSERETRDHDKADHGKTADQAADPLTALFRKSVLKMLSWKVIGVSAGLSIKYFFIGNLTIAAGLQLATTVVTGILYVGYDMVWATVFPDSRKPLIDFSSVTEPS